MQLLHGQSCWRIFHHSSWSAAQHRHMHLIMHITSLPSLLIHSFLAHQPQAHELPSSPCMPLHPYPSTSLFMRLPSVIPPHSCAPSISTPPLAVPVHPRFRASTSLSHTSSSNNNHRDERAHQLGVPCFSTCTAPSHDCLTCMFALLCAKHQASIAPATKQVHRYIRLPHSQPFLDQVAQVLE